MGFWNKPLVLVLLGAGSAFAAFPDCSLTVAFCCQSAIFKNFTSAFVHGYPLGSLTSDKEDPTCSLLNLIPNAAQIVCPQSAVTQTVCSALALNEDAKKRMTSGAPLLGIFIIPGTCGGEAAEGPHQNRWEEFNAAQPSNECSGSELDVGSNTTHPFLAGAVTCPKDARKGLSVKAKWLSKRETKGFLPKWLAKDTLGGFDVCKADYTPGGLETSLSSESWQLAHTGLVPGNPSVQWSFDMRVACQDFPASVGTVQEKVIPYKILLVSIGDLLPCQFTMSKMAGIAPPSSPAPGSSTTMTFTPSDSSASAMSSSGSSASLRTFSASLGIFPVSSSGSSGSESFDSKGVSGSKASGSSASYLPVWQWLCWAALCLYCCLVAGGAFPAIYSGKKRRAKNKRRPTKPAARPQEAEEQSEFPLLPAIPSFSSVQYPAPSFMPAIPSYSMLNTSQVPLTATMVETPLSQLPAGTLMPVYSSQA